MNRFYSINPVNHSPESLNIKAELPDQLRQTLVYNFRQCLSHPKKTLLPGRLKAENIT